MILQQNYTYPGMEKFLRPSSMAAAEWCPGRPTMEARAVDMLPWLSDLCSEPARLGTIAHAVIARILSHCFTGDWSQAPAILANQRAHLVGHPRWIVSAVENCTAYAVQVVGMYAAKYHRIEILTEEHLNGLGIGLANGGTADFILLCFDAAGNLLQVIVVDWKTGFVYQGDAADHLQLACYAIMARDRWSPRDGVIVHLALGRRQEFTSAMYDETSIHGARHRMLSIGAAAKTKAPKLHPCLKACRYCKALCFCRPCKEHLMIAVEKLKTLKQDAAETLALFSADDQSRLAMVETAKLAECYAKDVKALAAIWRDMQAESHAFQQSPEQVRAG